MPRLILLLVLCLASPFAWGQDLEPRRWSHLPSGLNVVGMKRFGMTREDIHAARAAYKHLFSGEIPVLQAAREMPDSIKNHEIVKKIADFVLSGDNRALCTPRSRDDQG